MKHIILLLMALLAAAVSQAQDAAKAATDTVAADSAVNVVAWFTKTDTIVYTQKDQQLHIAQGDTAVMSSAERRYRIAVLDSTSKGYRLEFVLLGFAYNRPAAGKTQSEILDEMMKSMQGLRVIFTTDELGRVRDIENLKDVRTQVYAKCDSMISAIYAANPALYAKRSKPDMMKDIHRQLDTTYGSKQRFLEQMDALTLLFGNHGRSFNLGRYEEEENGTSVIVNASQGKADADDESASAGDYQVFTQVTEPTSATDSQQVIVYTDYFPDGWPRYAYFCNQTGSDAVSSVNIVEIEWESRMW